MTQSNRAKKNFTKQMKGRLEWLESDLATDQGGLEQARYYCKLLKKPFRNSFSYKAYSQGIAKTKRQIASLKKLIKKRERSGEIFKIL